MMIESENNNANNENYLERHEFRLVLHHDFVDAKGVRFKVEQPISAEYIIAMSDYMYARNGCVGSSCMIDEVLHRLFDLICKERKKHDN